MTLTGWGQRADALVGLGRALGGSEVVAADYARAGVAGEGGGWREVVCGEWDVVAGWSLGGQLAVRAIGERILRTRRLVLVAAPWRFVGEEDGGMPRRVFEEFRLRYRRGSEKTLRRAWDLVAQGDTRADGVRAELAKNQAEELARLPWGEWLDELERVDCGALGLGRAEVEGGLEGGAVVVHGTEDAVVGVGQAERWQAAIGAKVVRVAGCGHAPHWHDLAGVVRAVADV